MKTNFLLICTLCASLVYADTVTKLYHRIWNPATPPSPFSLRADIHYAKESGFTHISPETADQFTIKPDQIEDALYQVAIRREGVSSEDGWDLSSVKACHLEPLESDVITFHLSPSQEIYAIDYFVRPVPRDGVCPKLGNSLQAKQISFSNTTFIPRSANPPPLPQLRTPPPLTPQGEPVQPQAEQSFFQKYWMYMALALVVFSLTGAPAPEEERSGQTGGRPSGGGR